MSYKEYSEKNKDNLITFENYKEKIVKKESIKTVIDVYKHILLREKIENLEYR
jgi:hypothetical protein